MAEVAREESEVAELVRGGVDDGEEEADEREQPRDDRHEQQHDVEEQVRHQRVRERAAAEHGAGEALRGRDETMAADGEAWP